jgi:hypothetical protein
MPRLEQNNSVSFTVKTFTEEFHLDPLLRPTTNDWTVTGKGAVVIRMTWAALPWHEQGEKEILSFCDRVVEQVRKCSE